MSSMPITFQDFRRYLIEAGVIGADDRVRHVVIDARHGHTVAVHVEFIGDRRLLSVVRSLNGVEVRRDDPATITDDAR
jgi:hypothetical protein